jgi:hypothetical protein
MMIDVKDLYKENTENEYEFYDDYQPMLNAFGTIVIQVDDDDYQGDSRVLYEDGEKIGLLIFGWGSCSGCDALKGCSSLGDVQELCDDLQNQIKWFDSKGEALEYFKAHDWKGDYSWHFNETRVFIAMCVEFLCEVKKDG